MDILSDTDSYFSLFLSLPNLEPITILSVFFLTLARMLPILAIVPFLGPKVIPNPIRMMFAISFAAIFLPANILHLQGNIIFNMSFAGFFLKEILVGTVLGIFASAPFFAAQGAGTLIDNQRGSSSLQVTDPTTQSQTSPVGNLYYFTLLATFFFVDGPGLFFNAIADSYLVLPLDQMLNPLFFQWHVPFWKQVVYFFSYTMNLTIQLGAPALVSLFLTDLFLGIANRMAPQVQITFLGMPLKSWVGLALVAASWALVIRVMTDASLDWIKLLDRLILESSPFKGGA